MDKQKLKDIFEKHLLGLPNRKGELVYCNNCSKYIDIRRGSIVICACGNIVKSKQYDKEWFKDYIAHEL